MPENDSHLFIGPEDPAVEIDRAGDLVFNAAARTQYDIDAHAYAVPQWSTKYELTLRLVDEREPGAVPLHDGKLCLSPWLEVWMPSFRNRGRQYRFIAEADFYILVSEPSCKCGGCRFAARSRASQALLGGYWWSPDGLISDDHWRRKCKRCGANLPTVVTREAGL